MKTCTHAVCGTGAKRAWRPLESADWDLRYAGKELVWTADANATLMQEIKAMTPGHAIDLAAGEGRNAVWLAERGWKVRAVDFSEVGLAKGRRLAQSRQVAERIDFQVADLRGQDVIAEKLYDLVALFYLQIPQHELQPVLRRAARAVAPGGTLLLVAHDSANLTQGYGGPQHADVLYTAEQAAAALEGELQIEKACRVERQVATDDGMKIALDCVVRARRA